jgi:hypothetical protein
LTPGFLSFSNIIPKSLRARPFLARTQTPTQFTLPYFTQPLPTMTSTPTPDNLTSVLARLADKLGSLEERLARIEASAGHTIAATGLSADSQEATKQQPTKGKGRAKAPRPPSNAPPAKKERPTKKGAIPSSPVPLPLAQTFSTEGKTDRHLVTVVIPDASAQHVVGQGGKGLKQIHDISGARVNAYTLVNGSRDERHVSIRGTDLQVGDALVVLGKRLARKKVRPPKAKKTGPSKDSPSSAPLHPTNQQSSTLPRYSSTQRPGPSTGSRIVEVPTGEASESSAEPFVPAVVMASPSPTSTPTVPSVTMGSPSSSQSPDAWTPMQVNAILVQADWPNPPADEQKRLTIARNMVAQGLATAPLGRGRGNTARRSHPTNVRRGRG